MKLSTGKKTEKLNYDKNKERSYFFQKQGKGRQNRLVSFICFFISLKNLLARKGGKQEKNDNKK